MAMVSLSENKATGSHYTPTQLANFVAEKLIESYIRDMPQSRINIVDPAVGDGELILSMLKNLSMHGFKEPSVTCFDTNAAALRVAASRIRHLFPSTQLCFRHEDFLDFTIKQSHPSLWSDFHFNHTDLVIANPPYVRTQVMGAAKARNVSTQFGLSGRVDLYHAFILGIAHILEPGGLAGVIVSNRFMTTKSGESVRSYIAQKFEIEHIWDLGDTKLFNAAILPCVLILRRKSTQAKARTPKFTSIYSTKSSAEAAQYFDIFSALQASGLVNVDGAYYEIKHGRLQLDSQKNRVWRVATEYTDQWLTRVYDNTWAAFGDIGKIRVGVKTTADKVFIRSDWKTLPADEIPELLRPLATHHISRRFKALPTVKSILYPHQLVNGRCSVVNLENFPRTNRYLETWRSILEERKYVIEAGRKWYEIWVPQNPDLWDRTKIVFRDIAEKPTFWMDRDHTVVNGDCYWMVANQSVTEELLWLAVSVGNSSFIEQFYDHCFNNKLYAGRRRFITQYVEQFPLPDPSNHISQALIETAKTLYQTTSDEVYSKLQLDLDKLVWHAFGFTQKN